jgi:nicotinate-nucleotide adenylyltransferase
MLRRQRRIAFYGGTFDPVHNGHIAMAEAALHALLLDRVFFVPAARNPHKHSGPVADDDHRIAMLSVAIAHNHQLGLWTGELERAGSSYTFDTIEQITRTHPNCHILWLIGSDQLAALHAWHRIHELVRRVAFILVARPGHPFLWPRIPGLQLFRVTNPLHDVSASHIRSLLQAGQPANHLLPLTVCHYVEKHRLYRG